MAGELFILGILGLATGSFLTLVVEHMEAGQPFLGGRSHCNHCKKILRWWELLPVLSFVLTKGQCARCHKPIPFIYPIFEVITSLVFVGIAYVNFGQAPLWLVLLELILAAYFLVLFFYDWLYQVFPGIILLQTAVLAVIISLVHSQLHLFSYFQVESSFLGWASSPMHPLSLFSLGALVGGGVLALLALPSRGKWMGYGDVLLSAIIGTWVGYPLIIAALLVAFYSGAVVGIWKILRHRTPIDHRIAFGPFLIFGGIVVRVWGQPIFQFLIRLWGGV